MQTDDLASPKSKTDSGVDKTWRDIFHARLIDETEDEKRQYRISFDQAREYLHLGKPSQAMAICEELLSTNPAHPLFLGLKLEVENQQWQQRVDYLKELRTQLEQIPDLEWQATILQQALARNPNDPQLLEISRNLKGRRDLVNYIVASARKAENREDYDSAIERWGIVKEFYPAYPDLDLEIIRLDDLRTGESRVDVRAGYVQEIQDLISSGEFARAASVFKRALGEFPKDPELLKLRIEANNAAARLPGAQDLTVAEIEPLVRTGHSESVPEEQRPVAASLTSSGLGSTHPTVRSTREDLHLGTSGSVESTSCESQVDSPKRHAALQERWQEYREKLLTLAGSSWNGLQTAMTQMGLPERGAARYALLCLPLIIVMAFVVTSSRTHKTIVISPSHSEIDVSIAATPPGAQLVLDNGLTGTTRLSARLHAGAHTVTVSAYGYTSQSSRFLVVAGLTPVMVNLKPEPLTVRLNAKADWGTVSIDQSSPVPLDAGSFEMADIKPGEHALEFVTLRSRLLANFEFQPGNPARVANVAATADMVALITSSYGDKTMVFCTCIPTMIAVDGKMANLPANGLELELSPGEHRFEVGTLGRKGYSVTTGGAPGLTVLTFPAAARTVVASEQHPHTENPETILSEVRGLMAEKHYVEAHSKLARVLAISPENDVALRIRKDLDTVRRLDPDNWK